MRREDTAGAEALGPGEAVVAYSLPELITDRRLLAEYEGLLSRDERARWLRFVRESDRHDFLVARALIRTQLSRFAEVDPRDWQFTTGAHGRPEIEAPPLSPRLRFNLSHTRGLVACIVALEHDVGIDVEDGLRSLAEQRLADRYFSKLEADALRELPEMARRAQFFRYWTLKESFVKAMGLGLALEFVRFSFHLDDVGVSISLDPQLGERSSDWQFVELAPTERHRMALSIRKAAGPEFTLRLEQTVPGSRPRRVPRRRP